MATTTATLAVKVTADASEAARGLDNVGKSAGGFQSGLNKAATAAAVGGAALVAFGKSAFDAASSAQQASGAVDAAFGGSADAIHKFAETSADSVGLASGDYEAMAATFGAQLKNMGVAADDLAPTTNDLVGLGADLAAQFGGSTADAVGALGSLLRGETDPIEKYGVSIKAADIAAQKAEMGLSGLTGEADKQATTQATLALLTEQTADATGAFAREANTAAGQQQRANAAFEDASAALGEALLPVVSAVAKMLGKMAHVVKDNKGAFTALGAVLAGVAATILAVKAGTLAWNAAQKIAKAATLAWQAAQWLLNAAMTANPIGLIIAGVAALTAGIILVVKNWDKVSAALKWTWNWLKSNWPKLLAIITGPFGVAVLVIIKHRDKIVKVIKKILEAARNVFKKIADIAKTVFRAITDFVKRMGDRVRGIFNKIRDVARTVFRAIASVVKSFASAVRSIFTRVRSTVSAAFRAVRDVARSAFDAIRGAIGRTIDTVRRIIDVVRSAFSAAWRAMRDVARSVFEGIRTAIQTTIDKVRAIITIVRDTLGGAWRSMRDTAKSILEAVRTAIQTTKDKISALVTYVTGTASSAWDTLSGAAEDAFSAMLTPIQWVIDKINSLIDLLTNLPTPHIDWPSPPSWVPIIGKSGPTTPAPAPTIGARGVGAAGTATRGAGGITVNVTGALDPDAVARQIERLLTARSRRVGGVRRVA